MAAPHRARNLVDALNDEWAELVDRAPEAVAGWSVRQPALQRCSGLVDVLDRVRSQPDQTLAALLTECARGERLAARVVLQAMLGKVVVMANRDPRAGLDDYVAALWITITNYPLARRAQRIAANLALDTLKAVRREQQWLRRGEVTPYPPDAFVRELVLEAAARERAGRDDGEDLDARRVIAAAQRLGLISEATGAVLTSVYADGLSGQAAGERHHTSPAAIRYRCSTSIRRLAQHAGDLADVA